MKHAPRISVLLLAALALLWVPSATAGPITFNFEATATNGLVIDATMQLSSSSSVPAGWYLVTGISGTVIDPTGNTGFATGAITGLDPASGYDIISNSGRFIIDNKINPMKPFFDYDSGLGFYVGSAEMNIWSGSGYLDWYQVSAPDASYQSTQILDGSYSGEINGDVTPEPATLILFGTGMAGIVGRMLHHRLALKLRNFTAKS